MKKHKLIISYIFAHFAVDFTCAFLLYRLFFNQDQWYWCLFLYNFFAFAVQMPIGLLADRWNHNTVCAAIGCGLIALSYGFGSTAVIAVIIMGIGNSMFHIGGGIDVLNISHDKPTLLGIFVSPGALGIYLGTLTGHKGSGISTWSIVSIMLIIAVAILTACYSEHHTFRSNNSRVSFPDMSIRGVWFAMGCLLFVVCLRSYLGLTLNFAWKSSGNWGIILIMAIVLGKATGGFLAHKLGLRKAAIISLGLAAVLFLFSQNPIFGTLAVFLFNMTMPMTLWAMAKILSGCKGFAFGILTFGLFLGFVPVYLDYPHLFSTCFSFALVAIASLMLFLLGIRKEFAR